MRVHHLRARGFGPFADEVEVDFDAVSTSGLFLIHGPTGAGKTSLLDAICFALFADVPGQRDRRGIVSDHRAAGVAPEVEVVFTCGDRRLMVVRSPAHTRPKKRGSGVIEAPATVRLSEWRDGEWAVISTRNDEVAEVLHDVLGMGLGQFATVAMLPQGEFARFLTAKDDDRRALLATLFDISRFSDIEQWFADERRASEQAVRELGHEVASDLARITDIVAGAAPDVDDPPSKPEDITALSAWLDSVGEVLDSTLTASMVALDAAMIEHTQAARLAEVGRACAATQQRGRSAREAQRALLAQRDEVADARERLAAGSRATAVQGHLAAQAKATDDLESAEADHRDAVAHVTSLLGGDGASLMAAGEATARTLHEHDDTVREIVRVQQARTARAHEVSAHHEALTQATELLRHADESRHEAQARCEAARIELTLAEQAAIELPGARAAALDAQRTSDLAAQTLLDDQAASSAAARAADARDAAQDARAHEQDLMGRHLAHQAALLAETLSTDQPCPVCGSALHPAPAESGDRVQAAEVEQARHAYAEAETHYRACESRAAAARATVDAALQPLGVDAVAEIDPALLAQQAQTARTHADTLSEQAARRDELHAAHDAAEACLTHLASEVDQAGATAAEASTIVARLDVEDERDRSALAALVRAHEQCPCANHLAGAAAAKAIPVVAGHLAAADFTDRDAETNSARHTDLAHALDRMAGTDRRLTEMGVWLADLTESATQGAYDAGFASVDEARQALLTQAQSDELERTVREFDDALARATSVLEDPEVESALQQAAPDLPGLTQADKAATTALMAAQARQTSAEVAHTGFSSVRERIAARANSHADVMAQHERITDLAETFAGGGANNTLRMRLTSYVLAARLAKVATLANERLRILGEGRYTLEHTDRRAARGARSGLGLRVLDQWTGLSRETSSLSGGEAFMASLALALGLADAVREEAGGFDIATLFVDEGFGTLDDDSLEDVIGVLDSLREGGRAVGVVSHVGELRTRIPHQVVVSKTPHGSQVRVRGAGEGTSAA